MSDDGSEGSPRRPIRRKIKKVMVLSSASESDSDESVIGTSTRRKRLRVVSEDGESSSGSSVVARRKRALPALRDSDAGSDTSGWATDHSEAAAAQRPAPSNGFASDSSEGNSDKCSICLLRFKDQEVGTPETCEHVFCLDCITEWSKNVNTCPVDRITFNSIVVRAFMGGRVLRTEPVKVVERRSSVDVLVVEDPTPCEICRRTDNEESMLLCDGCDLGYHMQCLTPPLTEVPVDEWICPNCDDLLDVIHVSELDDLFNGIADIDLPEGPRAVPLRVPRNTRRSGRTRNADEPSTSSGGRSRGGSEAGPSTSRGSRVSTSARSNRATTTRRRTAGAQRRKYKRRKVRTVVIEYEVEENGKFPVTKTVRRKLKKRKSRKRQPRTAARRSHVRASVRARLAGLRDEPRLEAASVSGASSGVRELNLRRHRAGIPTLSLLGDPYQLDYFSEDEVEVAEGGATAVAARPTPAVCSAFRQARRKMVSIPSPPHASATPDLLSGILESQALLHSKRTVVTVDSDGRLDISLKKEGRVDVRGAAAGGRQAPSYGGNRGGWGGGYRGRRVPPAAPGQPHYAHSPSAPPPHSNPPPFNRRDDYQPAADYGRRPPHYDVDHRRENGRPRPPWPRGPAPLDMRTRDFTPLPEPPVFRFDKPDAGGRSDEEEPTDLVIDTEKYDPTEPTNDDDSGDESQPPPALPPALPPSPAPLMPPLVTPMPPLVPPPAPPVLLTSTVLDTAVREVLQEHSLSQASYSRASDPEDSDGDCPNFNIYSATSVHIASQRADTDLSPPSNSTPTPSRTREDEYKEKVSKRCPITTNTRNPIKIKLNTPSLIRRPVSLYDDDEADAEPAESEPEVHPESESTEPEPSPKSSPKKDTSPKKTETEIQPTDNDMENTEDTDLNKRNSPLKDELVPESVKETESEVNKEVIKMDVEDDIPQEDIDGDRTPDLEDEPATPATSDTKEDKEDNPEDDEEPRTPADTPTDNKSDKDDQSEDETSEKELGVSSASKKSADRSDDALEKMTESISETEDERSYTPCLDENKSKDTSLETEKERGIEGLDTEMISEEEGNDMFSDEENRPPSERAVSPDRDDGKKKKKKESKKESKDKKKKKDIAFKKLSKNGKERNYRDKDKDKNKKDRRDSEEAERKLKRKEKRKDLERYDVRTVVTEKRRRKDAFGRDVSPRRSASGGSATSRRRSPSAGSRRRRSESAASRRRPERSVSPPAARRPSASPRRRPSASPRRRPSASPRRRPSASPRRRPSASPRRRPSTSPRRRVSMSPRRRPSITPRRRDLSPLRKSASPRRKSPTPKRKSASPRRRSGSRPPRRRRSASRARKRRRDASRSPKPKGKKKKRARSERRREPRRKSPKRKRAKRSQSPVVAAAAAERGPRDWERAASVDSRLLSPRTPPPVPARRPPRRRDTGPSKEVFTSGDNILVSVSFKDQERGEQRARREAKRDKRRKRRRAQQAAADAPEAAKPVAIIDLERSPFRELTPSPKNVIVLSDSDHGEPAAAPPPAPEEHHQGPKTPPEPQPAPVKFSLPPPKPPAPRNPLQSPRPEAGPATPPDSPDAYDPFEPTAASPSPPPADPPAPPSPPRHITLEGAQKTNMSADDVIDRRPVSPIEKVMALLQSTRDVSPEPVPGEPPGPPAPPAPRVLLPEPARAQPPKLFLAKPSPIKSNPVKPMQMQTTKISRLPLPPRTEPLGADSPYSPGSSDFGDLFEPPGAASKPGGFDSLFDKPPKSRKNKSSAAKVPVKLNRKKGNKTQVGVKIDEDNLKILDDLPSSAVEMQVKSKFLKKLNRQERVVEEVKLVLKPHYNKKRVSKDEYKDILRRAVPKICHNKTGEINPTKIQALVEAYVKKIRKKHKLGLS